GKIMADGSLFAENTKENIYHCIKCGLCLAHCPVYKEALSEEATPRGKVQLSRHLSEGSLRLSAEVKDAFFSTCLLCGSCVANCPSGVHGDHLFSGIRWRAVQQYGIDWKKKVMFQLLANKWMMSPSVWFGKWARKMFGGSRIASKLSAGALDMARIPAFNEKPFSRMVPEVAKPEQTVRAKVLYFHGCATNYLYGDIGLAVVDVLNRMGVEGIIPREQACCGLPIFMSGDRETSLQCIRSTLAIFARRDVDAVVVDCATCGAALKNEYAHLLLDLRQLGEDVKDEEIKAAELLSGKLRDVTVFIEEHRDWLPAMKEGGPGVRVTYHDPCHLIKGQKIGAPPRNILKSLPGVEYVELPGASDCCGGGGSFQVEHAEISRKITKRKVDNIQDTKANILATCCPGCNLTIANHLDPAQGVQVRHPVQLLQTAIAGK
ncbi:MAG: (Fe-S)-binding protein, partial [Deltaproteobacteria bacterium]|nr:(Fe-S)-binding protein [Deltaproteobacteria bacterium]